jgi:hypothetical protein
MNHMSNAILAAAISGILAGVSGCERASSAEGMPDHPAPAASDSAGAKHACKGQNACKGQGGCKTEKHACKGQNACKGQGGCHG